MRVDIQKLGVAAVYLGHPVTIALCVVLVYESFAEADRPTGHGWAEALGNSEVPGAGGNVACAINLLRRLRDGMPAAEVLGRADDTWAWCDDQKDKNPDRWRRGQQQADELKPRLLGILLEKWGWSVG